MATYVVLRSNRVVRGYLANPETLVAPGETIEEFVGTHPGSGYFVYETNGTFRQATIPEIREARVDSTLEAQRRAQLRQLLIARMDDIRDDATLPVSLRALVAAWKNWFEDR